MTDQELIDKVFNDPDFPERKKNCKDFSYVVDNRVFWDFTSSIGDKMRYCCYYGKYNLDSYFAKIGKPTRGEFECLIIGTEFI
jgi:hypothetical protein